MHTPFDPLQLLTAELGLDLHLDPKDNIVCKDIWRLPPHQQKQAKAVLRIYNKLLRMQLDVPSESVRSSVRKLLAQGKIEIKSEQYVLT